MSSVSRCPRRFVCLLAVPVANQVDVVEVEEVRGEGQSGESISLAVVSADLPAKPAGLERRYWPAAVPSVRNSTHDVVGNGRG